MPTKKEMNELNEALEVMKIELSNKPDSASFPFAPAYAEALTEAISMYGTEGLKTRLLYILSNLQYWRGTKARKCKEVFKNIIDKL